MRPWVPALLPDRLAQRLDESSSDLLDELATGLSQGSLSRASLESSGVGCPARPEREKAKVEVPSLASPGEATRFTEKLPGSLGPAAESQGCVIHTPFTPLRLLQASRSAA